MINQQSYDQYLTNKNYYEYTKEIEKIKDYRKYEIINMFNEYGLKICQETDSGYIFIKRHSYFYVKLGYIRGQNNSIKNFVKITSDFSKVEILCNGQVTRGRLKGYKKDRRLINNIIKEVEKLDKEIENKIMEV